MQHGNCRGRQGSAMLYRKTIAEMLGITPDTFRRCVESRPDFPKPALRLGRKAVRWDGGEVNQWIARHRATAQRNG